MSLNVELLKNSFNEVAPQGKKFVEKFYKNLFEMYPEVKPLFSKTNMKKQPMKLLNALKFVVDNLEKPDILACELFELGKRHEKYCVKKEHYPLVGSALLETFSNFFKEKWTPELKESWTDAYGVITDLTLKGYKGSSKLAA